MIARLFNHHQSSESLSVLLFAAASYFGQDPLIPCSWFLIQEAGRLRISYLVEICNPFVTAYLTPTRL